MTNLIKLWLMLAMLLLTSQSAMAQQTVCAVVKIEILQELTLERQAFEATLKIENTLVDKTLENIEVVVKFVDENEQPVVASSDPNNTNADFFIRVNSLEGISDVSGSGSLEGGKSAIAKWLIIPAPGSSGNIPSGKLYFVSADFNYVLDNQADTISVAPDSIYVKPMPLLTLDYFLPRDVFADDPLTQNQIEPIEPFTLGVRVQNNGSATANGLKIESAQPRIVENEQGLLIDFKLLNSFVQDQPVNNSLLIDFGDIPSQESKMGRWNMTTTLSGRFTEFTADFTHADELGGELTSLLEQVNTHTLLRDVLVDEPGRDAVKDFLAADVFDSAAMQYDLIKVYESNSTTTPATNQSSSAQLITSGDEEDGYTFTFNPTAGFAYVEVPDPFNGTKEVLRVLRDDGKELNLNNVWFSRRYNRTTKQTEYLFNLFDANTSGVYRVFVGTPPVLPSPPVLQFIALKSVVEGQPLGFLVEASDPNGTLPTLFSDNLPAGAELESLPSQGGLARSRFLWTPTIGQAGRYDVTFAATDGDLTATQTAVILVNSVLDTDGDGLLDQWELDNFGDLSRDGTGDADGDGVSDLDEFEQGSDPNVADGPLAPVIISPALEAMIAETSPELTITNSEYSGPFTVTYEFELYSDANYTTLVDAYYAQPQGESGETSWVAPTVLEQDQNYYWRVRAFDTFTYSPWVEGRFSVNSSNTLPEAPVVNYPSDGLEVSAENLVFNIAEAIDADGDTLNYRFFLYSDSDATDLIAASGDLPADGVGSVEWALPRSLAEGQTYYWRAEVFDGFLQPVSTPLLSFTTAVSNTAPAAPVLQSPIDGERVASASPVLLIEDAVDAEQTSGLAYFFEVDIVPNFERGNKVTSGWLLDTGVEPTFSWPVSIVLEEDRVYYWRVKTRDSQGLESPWAQSSFVVNAVNSEPDTPSVKNPGDQSQVITRTPMLEVFPVVDADGDTVQYEFELYSDDTLIEVEQTAIVDVPEWMLTELQDNQWYYWRARVIDENGAESPWMPVSRFFVNEDNVDNPPEFTWLLPEPDVSLVIGDEITLRWEDSDPDSSATINLYYATEPTGTDAILFASSLEEDADAEGDQFTASTAGLAAGRYYLFAEIADDTTSVVVSSESVFSVVLREYVPQPLSVANVSGEGSQRRLGRLIDGDLNTRWAQRSNQPIPLEFDLGEVRRLDSVRIAFQDAFFRRYEYSVETSVDGQNWTEQVDRRVYSNQLSETDAAFAPHQARYVRITLYDAFRLRFTRRGPVWRPIRRKAINEIYFMGGQ